MFQLLFKSAMRVGSALVLQAGLCARWLLLLMLLVIVMVLILRNGLDHSSAGVEELKLYAQAYLIMIGASYVQQLNGHVRVDVLYGCLSQLARDWIDLLGHVLFALPFYSFLLWLSADFAYASATVREASTNPGGLPFLYIMKAALPLGGLLLIVQCVLDIFNYLARVSLIQSVKS